MHNFACNATDIGAFVRQKIIIRFSREETHASVGDHWNRLHRSNEFTILGLIKSLAQRYYPIPACISACTLAAHGSTLIQRGHSVVNAASLLRADAAHEPSLQPALRECVSRAVRRYLADVESEPSEGLHALVLREVECPLLREVLTWYGGNQSRAAAALGINRATLRKKLQQYGLLD